MNNIYQPKEAIIVSAIRESIDTVKLKMALSSPLEQKRFSFAPGQFMQIGLAGWGECPISICSAPRYSSKYFELAIRDVGQLTGRLCRAVAGDKVLVRGPFGNGFDYGKFRGKDVVLIGGGCGFVPLRPIISDHISGQLPAASLRIFYGCLNEKTILFSQEHKSWKEKSRLDIVLEKPSAKWRGPIGLVTDLLKKAKLEPDSVAVLVGPPVMYRFVIPLLLKKCIKPENIMLSLERKMYCGRGVCQHCAVGPYYVCKDGPVFTYDQLMNIKDAI